MAKAKKAAPKKKSGVTIGWFGITAIFVILFIMFTGLAKSNNECREELAAMNTATTETVEVEEAL